MSPEIDLQVIHVSQNTCVSVYKNLINFKNSNTDSPFANFLLGSFFVVVGLCMGFLLHVFFGVRALYRLHGEKIDPCWSTERKSTN